MSSGNEDSLRRVIKTKEQADLFMRELNHAIEDAQPERLLTIPDLLIGKDMLVMSDMGEIRLTIKDVKFSTKNVQVTPDTRENDWWGQSYDYEVIVITFTNGHSKEFKSPSEIKVYSK
jgi:hypothetical protein